MYNLVGQIQLQAPNNAQASRVVNQINKQLQGVTVSVRLNANNRQIQQTVQNIDSVSKSSKSAAKNINTLGQALGTATRRFGSVAVVTGGFLALTRGIKNALGEAIKFEREVIRISQVTGKSTQQLRGLVKEVTNLSISLGVSSSDILTTARTLSQAGFAAESVTRALKILSQTTLAPTFDSIADTTEGAIALLNQFRSEAAATGDEIKFLEDSLGAINEVSKRFAVESSDLISVIRRTGGVFEASGGSLNELLALFTSVRSTTRESADTIATGFRTIFTRIQRVDTIENLRALGIELQDAEGKFIGPIEAIKRLSIGLSALDPKDYRFNQIVEDLGGFRQIGKVIPLIKQFEISTEALAVAQEGQNSIAEDAEKAQESLEVRLGKVREKFAALFRELVDSKGFKQLTDIAITLAEALIKVGDALIPLVPLLTAFVGIKIGSSLTGFGKGLLGRNSGGPIGFASGGFVPGSGNRDTVPAMLTPGEFVIRKSSVESIGAENLAQMNSGGNVQKFTFGGGVTGTTNKTKGLTIDEAIAAGFNKSTITAGFGKEASDAAFSASKATKKGNETPGEITGIQLRKRFGISFLEGSPFGEVQSTINSVLSESNKTGAANLRKVIGKRSIRPGARLEAPNAKVGFLSSNGLEIFKEEVEGGIVPLFDKATKRFSGELNPGKVGLNELISNSAIQSIKGQFFEAFVRRISGNVIKDDGSPDPIFDFKSAKNKEDLLKLFNGVFQEPNEFKNNPSGSAIPSSIGKAFAELNSSQALVNVSGEPKQFALGGSIQKFRKGGSPEDTVPALLTPGEYVFNSKAADKIGRNNLDEMNRKGVIGFNKGGAVGNVRKFAKGGTVGVSTSQFPDISSKVLALGKQLDAAGVSVEKINKILPIFSKSLQEGNDDFTSLSKSVKDLGGDVKDLKTGVTASGEAAKEQEKSAQELKKATLEEVNSKAESANKAFNAAQNFVFLAATASTVVSAFSSFSDETKAGVTEFATQFSVLSGIIGTVGPLLVSLGTAMSASAIPAIASLGPKIIAALGPLGIAAAALAAVFAYSSARIAAAEAKFGKAANQGIKELEKGDTTNLNRTAANIVKEAISGSVLGLGNVFSSSIFGEQNSEQLEIQQSGIQVGKAFISLVKTINEGNEKLKTFNSILEAQKEQKPGTISTAASTANISRESQNLDKKLANLESKLIDLGEVTEEAEKKVRDSISSQISAAESQKKAFDELLKATVNLAKQQANEAFTKPSDLNKPIQALQGELVNLFLTLKNSGLEGQELLDAFNNQRDKLLDARDAARAFAKASYQAAQAADALEAALNVAADFDRVFKQFSDSISNSINATSGGAKVSDFSFDGFTQTGNINSFLTELDQLTGSFGQPGKIIRKSAGDLASGIKRLDSEFFENLINSSKNFGDVETFIKSLKLQSKDLEEALVSQLKAIQKGDKSFEKFSANAGGSDQARKDFIDNIAKLGGEAQKVLLKKFAEAGNLFVKESVALGDAIRKSKDNILSIIQAGNNLKLERQKQIRVALGGKELVSGEAAKRERLTFDARNREVFGKQNTQRFNQITGNNGLKAVSILGSFAEKAQNRAVGRANLAATSTDPEQRARLVNSSKNAARAADLLKDNLKQLADQSSVVNEKLSLINFEKSKIDAFRTALTDFTFATNEGRRDIQTNYAALNRTLATGSIESIPDQFRPVVGQLLDQFKDVELAPGLTGSEIKAEFEVQTLERILGRALSSEERDRVKKGTTSEIERLTAEISDISRVETAARQKLIDLERDNQTRFFTSLQDLQNNFFTRLEKILTTPPPSQTNNQQPIQQITGSITVQPLTFASDDPLKMTQLNGLLDDLQKEIQTLSSQLAQDNKARTPSSTDQPRPKSGGRNAPRPKRG